MQSFGINSALTGSLLPGELTKMYPIFRIRMAETLCGFPFPAHKETWFPSKQYEWVGGVHSGATFYPWRKIPIKWHKGRGI